MKNRTLLVIIAVIGLIATGCHSGRHTVRGDRSRQLDELINKHIDEDRVYDDEPEVAGEKSSDKERRLVDAARRWLGTPYRYGGNDRKGIDCSGFTCAVFKEVTGIKLPRSAREQADFCRRIDRRDLRVGDLVFFTSKGGGSRINHVAIFIGNNKIIHATSSQGVAVSDLDERYWSSHFHRCGRVDGWR